MEDVLGGRTDPRRFAAFLGDWEAVLARRVEDAVAALGAVDGVVGIILTGGVGRGEPWPLSDIDLLPIYADDRIGAARTEVERRRLAILPRWVEAGWWTGLDVGRLAFGRAEVARALATDGAGALALLGDDRWYHAIDKGYRGRAVYDPIGLAAPLARWLTDRRFEPAIVRCRLARERRELDDANRLVNASIADRDPLAATTALRTAVKWLQTGLLEGWGERDSSQGRLGSRFARAARAHGRSALVDDLDALVDLDAASVGRRMAAAPWWVRERHDRSWRARRHVGEAVGREADARDTLRVCALYGSRRLAGPPFPNWLAIPSDLDVLAARASRLSTFVPAEYEPETPFG